MIRKLFIIVIFIIVTLPVFSVDNETCMECHSDKEITKEIKGKEHSVFVDKKIFNKSIHAELSCTDCHVDVDTEDFPHKENLKKVDCSLCHDDIIEDYKKSIHGIAKSKNGDGLAAGCTDCHGTHGILSSANPSSKTYKLNIQDTCGKCHNDPKVLKLIGLKGSGPGIDYENSVHNKYLHSKKNEKSAPTCITCHGSHKILSGADPKCAYGKRNIKDVCGKCHPNENEEYTKSEHWKSLERGHVESPTCIDCHGEHRINSPEDKSSVTNKLNESSQICQKCHSNKIIMQRFGLDAERFSSYMKTYHGMAILKGSDKAATCTSCHEVHSILSADDPHSSVGGKNLLKTCQKCHPKADESFIKIPVHPDTTKRNVVASVIKDIYVWMIFIVIGGMFLHNLMIYIHHVRKKFREEKNSNLYRKFRPFEVYQHIALFISFSLLALTGFALKFPDSFFIRWLNTIGITEVTRAIIHRVSAVVLIISSFIQLGYFSFTKCGRRDVVSLIPRISDLKEFWQNLRFYLFFSKKKPIAGRFDYAEKAEYLALIWGTAVMIITGFILWFPEFFMRFLPWWAFEAAEVIHLLEAILATLAIIIWHGFFVMFSPEVYPIKTTWKHGMVTEDELEHRDPEGLGDCDDENEKDEKQKKK